MELYHPTHAVEAVGCKVVDTSNVWWESDSDKGGNLKLEVLIFDWDSEPNAGVMEHYSIYIESTCLIDPHVPTLANMTVTDAGIHWYTYEFDIPADSLGGNVGHEFWVLVEQQASDYSNPAGVPNDASTQRIVSCFRYDLEVADVSPPWIEVTVPDGGEIWSAGDDQTLTWDYNKITQNVNIFYSTDNFATPGTAIQWDTECDGSYLWQNIPKIQSQTVKIRIITVGNPQVEDYSDDFEVTPWFILTSPNGRETWKNGENHTIYWDSNGVTGLVGLAYSIDGFIVSNEGIAYDIANSGSWTWSNIPCDASDTVKLRVYSVNDDTILDDSDNNLTFTSTNGWGTGVGWAMEDTGVYADCNSEGISVAAGTWEVDPTYTTAFLRMYDQCGDSILMYYWPGNVNIFVKAVEIDDEGNVYAAGYFYGSMDLDPSPTEDIETNNGDRDAFLVKFGSDNTYQWGVTWGGTDHDEARDLAIRNDGYILVTGYFNGTDVDFNPGTGTYFKDSNGSADAFLTLFNQDGIHGGAVTWGGLYFDTGHDVASNTQDLAFVTGYYRYEVDFDPSGSSSDTQTSNGEEDV